MNGKAIACMNRTIKPLVILLAIYTLAGCINPAAPGYISIEGDSEPQKLIEFSHPAGFYTESLELRLTTDNPDAQIFFTTDGSIPNPEQNGTHEYTDSITLSPQSKPADAHVIRAAIVSDNLHSKTHTRHYFVHPDTHSDLFGIPVLYLVTNDGRNITSRSNWKDGYYSLGGHSGALQVSGRGNSTWRMPKKPYSLNLYSEAGLLDMPPHSRWVLLANYADKTLLRNDIAFHIDDVIDGPVWTPRSRQVVLIKNGHFQGVYQMVEQIRISPDRIDIPDINDTEDPDDGGYILEVDERRKREWQFDTSREVPVNIRRPAEIDELDFEHIQPHIQHVEDILYSSTFADPDAGYRRYLDIDAYIQWYLVNEIGKNRDAQFYSSIFMYYNPEDGLIYRGPGWDYDQAFGNTGRQHADNTILGHPHGFQVKPGPWTARLFQDPYFVKRLQQTWSELLPRLQNVPDYIDQRAAYLESAQRLNFQTWDILDTWVWPNRVVTGSYAGEIEYIKTWFSERIAWLDAQFMSM